MSLQTFYVHGEIAYTMKTGHSAIHYFESYSVIAPDAKRAEAVALADFERKKGASEYYDPQAKWYNEGPKIVINLTAFGIFRGDTVRRKWNSRNLSGVNGVVVRVFVPKNAKNHTPRARVLWDNGNVDNGKKQHSTVLVTALKKVEKVSVKK